MEPIRYFGVFLVAYIGALVSCAPQSASTRVAVSSASTPSLSARPDPSLNGRIFQKVDEYRMGLGANKMQRHSGLDKLAQAHCRYLLDNRGEFNLYGKNVSHFGSEGRASMAREAYSMMSVSENVAFVKSGAGDPATAVVQMWIQSPGHAYSMGSEWTHSGIGAITDSDGTVFATQIFATMGNAQSMMRQRFGGF